MVPVNILFFILGAAYMQLPSSSSMVRLAPHTADIPRQQQLLLCSFIGISWEISAQWEALGRYSSLDAYSLVLQFAARIGIADDLGVNLRFAQHIANGNSAMADGIWLRKNWKENKKLHAISSLVLRAQFPLAAF